LEWKIKSVAKILCDIAGTKNWTEIGEEEKNKKGRRAQQKRILRGY
jgi:hypothetical protein